jgi:hypothetical protein
MEDVHLHYDDLNKNKYYDLKDIIFQCFGNNPSSSCQFSGITTKLAIVYDIVYIKCYINSVHYGPGTCYSQDNGWLLYKQYRLVSIPDIPFIVSQLKKYERLMMLGKCGISISCSYTYGVDLIIDILKLVVNSNSKKEIEKEKDQEIEILKLRIRDEEQMSQMYRLKIESMTSLINSLINDKEKEIERLKMPKTIKEEYEIREADIKAKLFALKDKEAKERLRMFYDH